MEAVGQLAGGIAHDFNNLLTAIIGYAGLLPNRIGDDDVALRYIGEIERASGHAAHLTGQLLAFSHKQPLQSRTISLNTVVSETRSILDRLIAADVEIEVRLDPDLPSVHADPTQITGVLLNLCTNAQDAMPNGGRLLIETHAVDLDTEPARLQHVAVGRYATLSVTDTGAGIDEAIRDRIFEPFFTTKPVGKATGLGLATAYGIAHQSSGFLVAESPADNGASFRIYLPAVSGAPTETAVASQDDDRPAVAATILLVEDEPAVRNLTAEILTDAGLLVVIAANGAEALERLDEHPEIDVLLTDVVMPGINGPDLAERLHALNPKLTIIFMSGYSGDALQGRGIASDAPLLAKPFTPTQLRQAVQAAISSPNLAV
jgi:CheY-like chemotaxis protein